MTPDQIKVMTDIYGPLDEYVALLFFAHRNVAEAADKPMARYGMGRAHHRVLFFTAHREGLSMNQLLSLLGVKAQSLHRVIKDLMDAGLLEIRQGESDKRLRHLFLTDKGLRLERECSSEQHRILSNALIDAGRNAGDGFRTMLAALSTPSDRAHLNLVGFDKASDLG